MEIFIAAWFHDTGYLFAGRYEHEQKGVEIMRELLIKLTRDSELIDEIEDCIMATKMPRNPKNILEEIICDADTYHLGTEHFIITTKQFMEETKLSSVSFDKELFDKQTLNMHCERLLKPIFLMRLSPKKSTSF
ncbi:hypothetical protein A3860_34540 [Niastella vici]|uniref:HD domain-containing protein n=1 Tax=Niastella vici TaxID=1703345 RepID=A0A1V9FPE6_9BACT|nr:hypothetical protein [Niastella vici]OQP60198.1 hypothetical protein A3860_34540 [Niastella vici]